MIPKPYNKLSSYPIRKLRGAYDWTCKEFRELRAAIRDGDQRYLDKREKTLDQSPAQWAKFKADIVAQFPEIEDFEDNWPLFVILSADRKNDKQAIGRNVTKTGRRSAYKAEHCRMYVGKPLPRRNLSSTSSSNTERNVTSANSGELNNDDTAVESSSEVTEQSSIGSATAHTPVASVQTTGNSRLLREDDLNVDTAETQSTSHFPSVSRHDDTEDGSDNAQLLVISQNNKFLIESLALLGITNDKHLLIMNKLKKWGAGPAEYFDSLPNDKLPYLYKISVLNRMQTEQNTFSATSCGSRHRDQRSSEASGTSSPQLQALLSMFDMEELKPLFYEAHITTDQEFVMLQGLTEAQRLEIFDGDDFTHVRSFQHWMLEFILRHIDIEE